MANEVKSELPEDVRLYTPEQVASILQVTIQTVWRWTREGKLRCISMAGNRLKRYRHRDIAAFLDDLERGSAR